MGASQCKKKAKKLLLLGNREQGIGNQKKVFWQISDAPKFIDLI
ncbi:hypothetical protein [Okeania sp. SIO3I5]|nr:hypothetical protein [Okeania sp. SIO3I5]